MSELIYTITLKKNLLGNTIVGQSYYLKSKADRVIATIKAERDAYKDDRDCLQSELDELKAAQAELGCVKTAAAALLENYSGAKPSAGEVDALAEDITQLLTEKYNISKGII